jgi:hypothetical protein
MSCLELLQLQAEERHLLVVHVLRVRHGQHFGVRQLLGGLGLPVVGQLRVFLDGAGAFVVAGLVAGVALAAGFFTVTGSFDELERAFTGCLLPW